VKVRKCDRRCHEARGKRCACWCGGSFHGTGGAANRAALTEGVTDLLKEHGFEEGKTAYIAQTVMPLTDPPPAPAPLPPLPIKRYEFHVTIAGEGINPVEAWQEACQGFALNPGATPEADEITGELAEVQQPTTS